MSIDQMHDTTLRSINSCMYREALLRRQPSGVTKSDLISNLY